MVTCRQQGSLLSNQKLVCYIIHKTGKQRVSFQVISALQMTKHLSGQGRLISLFARQQYCGLLPSPQIPFLLPFYIKAARAHLLSTECQPALLHWLLGVVMVPGSNTVLQTADVLGKISWVQRCYKRRTTARAQAAMFRLYVSLNHRKQRTYQILGIF